MIYEEQWEDEEEGSFKDLETGIITRFFVLTVVIVLGSKWINILLCSSMSCRRISGIVLANAFRCSSEILYNNLNLLGQPPDK